MNKRSLWLVALLAVVALVATACPQGQQDGEGALAGVDITFSISLAEEEQATIRQLLDLFEQETGATVNLTAVTSQDMPDKLTGEVDSGTHTIHLFAQDNVSLRVLVDEELVEDLSDVEIPGEVLPSMIPGMYEGVQYFLPFRPNVQVVYLNRDRLEAAGVTSPPTTTEELRAAAEAMAEEAGGPRLTLSLSEEPGGDPAAVTISELVVSFGGNPLILNDEGSLAAYEFLAGLWADELLTRESLLAKFDTQVDYLTGETSWIGKNWPFTTGVLDDQGVLDRFDVYEGWAGPERAAHVIGGDVLGIPRGITGDELEAALQLAQFLMSQETQTTLAAENAWPSIRDDAYAEVPEAQQATFDAIQAALEDGWYRPNVPYWTAVTAGMNEAISRILEGGEPVKAVLDEINGKIAAAAQEAGQPYPPEAE